MKRAIICVFLFTVLVSCSEREKGYRINGRISGENIALKQGEAYLLSLSVYERIRDTVPVKNGRFLFRGVIKTPGKIAIRIRGLKGALIMYLENENYVITGNSSELGKSNVDGGETNTLLTLIEARKRGGLPEEEVMAMRKKLAEENPLSAFALDCLVEESKVMSETNEVKHKLEAFKADNRYRDNVNISIIEGNIEKKRGLDPGNPAPEFSMKDVAGNTIEISGVFKKNRLTMLYFWAGCNNESRIFNSRLLKIYNTYNPLGLEIVGLSLDDIPAEWLNAIRNDRLPWLQLSDLNGTLTPVVSYYEINSIPQNTFVDQQGKIVKRKVPWNELEKFIEKSLSH